MPTNRRLGDDLIAERNRFARQVAMAVRAGAKTARLARGVSDRRPVAWLWDYFVGGPCSVSRSALSVCNA